MNDPVSSESRERATGELPVAGIILAAGQSRRLGRPKQLLQLDSRPILEIVLDNARRSSLERVVLVLGSEADRIAAAIGDHGQQIVFNPDFADGQSTSLRHGIGAIGESAAGAIVLLGDQPQVTPEIINRLIAAFRESVADIVQPVYSGTPGNPVVFRRTVFPELLGITGDRGARDVIQQKRDAVLRVPIPGLPVQLEVDTDED